MFMYNACILYTSNYGYIFPSLGLPSDVLFMECLIFVEKANGLSIWPNIFLVVKLIFHIGFETALSLFFVPVVIEVKILIFSLMYLGIYPR